MNKLELFISSKAGGFLTDKDMPELIRLDRLFQVLVRCGGCRFTCAAQDVEHLIKCIESGNDYVRDVSFPVGSLEKASYWIDTEAWKSRNDAADTALELGCKIVATEAQKHADIMRPRHKNCRDTFDEYDCSGTFDGFGVVSDADPGL